LKFTLEYPVAAPQFDRALVTHDGMARYAREAERLGFSAVGFTEHPAPSRKWRDAGGHQNLDPIAAMAFCAAVTSRLHVMSYLLVLPYRNPFHTAKSLATVDLLADGRAIAVAGTGYLRSEFRALGADFDSRNESFDEAIEVMRGVWVNDPYDFTGKGFTARSVSALPQPRRRGGVPIWVGGNSALSRRRAARLDGWSPIMSGEQVTRTARTADIRDVSELSRLIAQVRESAVQERGEGARVEVQLQSPQCRWMFGGISVEEHLEHLGELREAGVDWVVLKSPGADIGQSIDALARYADSFLRPF
jgi:probable F420-dependent oxidoreductase